MSSITKIIDLAIDNNISHADFLKMEEALFTHDGYVDMTEAQMLGGIISSESPVIFQKSEDKKLWEECFKTHAFTTERYLLLYDRLGIKLSDTRRGQLMAISDDPINSIPEVTISGISKLDDGSFDISLRSAKRKVTVNSDHLFDTANKPLFYFTEVVEALVSYMLASETEALSQQTEDCLNHIHGQFIIFMSEHGSEALALTQSMLTGFASPIFNPQFLPWTDPKNLEPYQYYGQEFTPAQQAAIHMAIMAFPKQVSAITADYKIYAAPYSQYARAFYNGNPEFTGNIFPFGGATLAVPSCLFLSMDVKPHLMGHYFAHEIGHALYFRLAERTGARFANGADQQAMEKGTVADVLSNHYANLQADSRSAIKKFPTLYGASNAMEWFAEAFAIYTLGKRGASGGIDQECVLSEYGCDYQAKLDEFKQNDPVGYLLMAKLDQYLNNPENKTPEKAFSWATYNVAQQMVKDNGGIVDSALESQWLNTDLTDPLTCFETLYALNSQTPFTGSAQKEYLLINLEILRNPDIHLENYEEILQIFCADFFSFLQDHKDKDLIDKLINIFNIGKYQKANKTFYNSNFLNLALPYLEKRANENPNDYWAQESACLGHILLAQNIRDIPSLLAELKVATYYMQSAETAADGKYDANLKVLQEAIGKLTARTRR